MSRRTTEPAAAKLPTLQFDRLIPADADAAFTGGALVDEERYEGLDFSGFSFAEAHAPHTEFVDCVLAPGDIDGLLLTHARIIGCRWMAPRAAAFDAANARLDNCEIIEPRFGAADLHGATLDRVAIDGGKIDYINLRGASIADLTISGTLVGELDIADAKVRRLTIVDSRLGRLDVRGSSLTAVDLRGADLGEVDSLPHLSGSVINDVQLYDLAPALAAHVGIEVRSA